MDEATNWQLEIIHRDIVHQVEWMERNGVIDAAKDAAKALRDSGIIDAMERVDRNPIIDGFNALNNSGVVTRKGTGASRTAESQEPGGNGSSGSMGGTTATNANREGDRQGGPETSVLTRKSKRGPRRIPEEKQRAAVEAWEGLDRDLLAITLDEFLDDFFGSTGGKLNVPSPTFYSWRKKFKNS